MANDCSEDMLKISCDSMSGDAILQFEMAPEKLGADLHRIICSSLDKHLKLQIILPCSALLTRQDLNIPVSELLSQSYVASG